MPDFQDIKKQKVAQLMDTFWPKFHQFQFESNKLMRHLLKLLPVERPNFQAQFIVQTVWGQQFGNITSYPFTLTTSAALDIKTSLDLFFEDDQRNAEEYRFRVQFMITLEDAICLMQDPDTKKFFIDSPTEGWLMQPPKFTLQTTLDELLEVPILANAISNLILRDRV